MPASRSLRALAFAALVLAPLAALRAQVPAAADPPRYALPPPTIVQAFDAEPLPQTLVSPDRQTLAVLKARAYPTIAELSQPMLRLAGLRVNARTNGPFRASGLPGTGITAIALKRIADGAEATVTMPPQPRVSHVACCCRCACPGSRWLRMMTTIPPSRKLRCRISISTCARSTAPCRPAHSRSGSAHRRCWRRCRPFRHCQRSPRRRAETSISTFR